MSQTVHDPHGGAHLRLALNDDEPLPPGGGVRQGPHEDKARRVAAECDALADLFMNGGGLAPTDSAGEAPVVSSRLGPGAARATANRPLPIAAGAVKSGPAPIEAVVLGHLPVLATAWGPQYARMVAAETSGPVALVRFRAGAVSVELFGQEPPATQDTEPDLAGAIGRAALRAARWLVSVDATAEPALADLFNSGAVGSLTLLTGADEAACVSCYRTMKSLLGSRESDEALSVRIAVMGKAEPAAREAGDRLARATEAFLGFRPAVVVGTPRIEPAPSVLLFRGSAETTLNEGLAMISATRAPEPAGGAEPPLTDARGLFAEETIGAGTPLTVPSVGRELRADAPDLASLVPGLRGLPVRCPHARQVQFAACPSGLLHALAWDIGNESPPVAALAAAGAWAMVNAELISAACRGVTLPAGATVVQHVFTRDARRVRSLLDTTVKFHLVLRPGGDGVAAGELN